MNSYKAKVKAFLAAPGRPNHAAWQELAFELAAAADASSGPRVPLSPNVDGRDFYELCQTYRHARETMPHGMRNVVQAFADLQAYIKTGALPWPSYDQQDATNNEEKPK